jgi:hypothetical protein
MHRSGLLWRRAMLAITATTVLLAVVVAPGIATDLTTSQSASPLTTGSSTTPPATSGCESRPSTVTYRYASPTVLTFAYSTPGVPDCRGSVRTVVLYREAAGTQPVTLITTPANSTAGNVNLDGLEPGTNYYYRVLTGEPSIDRRIQGPVTTQPAGTPRPGVVCDVFGGVAQVSARTATSASFTYYAPGALGCNLPGHPWLSTRLTIWADPDGAVEVARTSAAPGSISGVLTVTGLTPGADYYYRFDVLGAFAQDRNIYPVDTAGGSTPTPSARTAIQ